MGLKHTEARYIASMEAATRDHLLALSADFYRHWADEFDESRKNAWDSWARIVSEVKELGPIDNVLDLGCGNGRFASFLDDNGLSELNYMGIDSEPQLIEHARKKLPNKHFEFEVSTLDDALKSATKHKLIVCFGVFHHLPGKQYRQEVLNSFSDKLDVNGIAVLSLWQPHLLKNFATKTSTSHSIEGLEENDFLMGWKRDFSHLRYCHDFTDEEINELVSHSPFELVSQFQGSGNDMSNRYLIMQYSPNE